MPDMSIDDQSDRFVIAKVCLITAAAISILVLTVGAILLVAYFGLQLLSSIH